MADLPAKITVEEYLKRRPDDVEAARAAVEPYRHMTVDQRFEALRHILKEMDALLAGRTPLRTKDDEDFWRYWKDPLHGRPRRNA